MYLGWEISWDRLVTMFGCEPGEPTPSLLFGTGAWAGIVSLRGARLHSQGQGPGADVRVGPGPPKKWRGDNTRWCR